MHRHTEKEKKFMKNTWTQVTGVDDLQTQGYMMTLLMWEEKDKREWAEKLCKDAMAQNQMYAKTLEIIKIKGVKFRDLAKILNENYKKLTSSIVAISCKDNGEPLNNEMAQVLGLIKISKETTNKEIQAVQKTYLQKQEELNKKNQ